MAINQLDRFKSFIEARADVLATLTM
ncbi:MAG: hypothetical protein ACJAVN_002549, partial [Roseivirga sp.]